MLNLYVIRHGETEWNTEKRMQGRLDSVLTEKGMVDARLLGERLKGIEFSRVISSPSKRTTTTAKLVAGDRVNLETDERLMEIHLGAWQGKVEAEIEREFPEQYDAYWNNPAAYESVDGERFSDVVERILRFLNELEQDTSSGNVLVVTHGVVIKALYLLCRNAPISEIWHSPFIQGTSLTTIEIQGGHMNLVLEACTKHCTFNQTFN